MRANFGPRADRRQKNNAFRAGIAGETNLGVTPSVGTVTRWRQRRLPISEPSTPRMISRPTVEPIVRAALFAMASIMLSLRPLPVIRPPRESLIEPMIVPAASLPAGTDGAAVDDAARPFNFS